MDSDRWARVQALFHRGLELPPDARRAFLQAECGDDTGLLDDALALLAADAGTGGGLLDRGLPELADSVLTEPEALPAAIGPYRVLGVLGRGGMGVVYLGQRDDLGSTVAIKVLRDAGLSPARRERFLREERTLAQLAHPGIARLFDADTLPDGTPWFVMEYVPGVPLTEYYARRPCTLPQRLRLFRDVCEAVQHAHRHAVIHRDLKPSNILVMEEDGEPRVKLLDFGIAKQLEATPADATQTVLRLLTPAYAAPEQLRGEPVGVYTDVYALGVLLYELLAGEHPYAPTGLSAHELELRVLQHEPIRPSQAARRSADPSRAPALAPTRDSAELDVICLRALQKEPQRRYATVEALIRDLDHFRRGEPLEARPDTIGYRVGKFMRRNRARVAAAAGVAVLLLATAGFHALRVAEARDAALAEAAKAAQVSDFLIRLFEAGDPFASGADSMSVRTLLARGVARAEELSGQPTVQAEMLDVLGRINTQLSDYGQAAPLLQQALALRQEHGDPLDVAESLSNIGRLHMHMGQFDSAEAVLRHALDLREQHLPPGHAELAVNLNDIASLLTDQGRYDDAEPLYRLALQIHRNLARPHETMGQTLANLGVNFFNRGDPAAAEPFYREALAADLMQFGPEHPNVGVRLANLATAVEARGDLAGADSLLTRASRILRQRLGEEHYLTAYTLIQHGALLRKAQDYVRAEATLRDAVAINERVLGADHPNTLTALNSLALALRDQGDWTAAEPLLQRVATGYRRTLGDNHYYTGASLCQLGEALHRNGRTTAAEPLLREGLAILADVLPADHMVTALNRNRYGEVLVALGRFDEAQPLLLQTFELLHQRNGPDHRDTQLAAARLVQLYEAWQRPEQAERFRGVAAGS